MNELISGPIKEPNLDRALNYLKAQKQKLNTMTDDNKQARLSVPRSVRQTRSSSQESKQSKQDTSLGKRSRNQTPPKAPKAVKQKKGAAQKRQTKAQAQKELDISKLLNEKPEPSSRGRKAVAAKDYIEERTKKFNFLERQESLIREAISKLENDESIAEEIDEIERIDEQIKSLNLKLNLSEQDKLQTALQGYDYFRGGEQRREVAKQIKGQT